MRATESPSFWRDKELWLLLLTVLLFYSQPLFTGKVFFFRDLTTHFLPKKILFADLVQQGEFPLWNPYLHGGQPLLGNPNNLALYPTNLLYLIFTPSFALTIDIVFHVLLSAVAMYAFTRVALRLQPLSSFVSGSVYTFCGFSLSVSNMLGWRSGLPYLPLLMLFWDRYLESKRFKWFSLASVAGAMPFFAGVPEFGLICFATLLGWTLVRKTDLSLIRRTILSGVLCCSIVAFASIQIIPSLTLLNRSLRSGGIGFEFVTTWSLHPKRVPELILPAFIGTRQTMQKERSWGENLESDRQPLILSIYFGIATLSLSAMGAVRSDLLDRKRRAMLVALVLLAFFFSFGKYMPGMKTIHHLLPFLAIIRFPVKYLSGAMFPLAVLAALGVSSGSGTHPRFRWQIPILLILSALLALLFFSPSFGQFVAGFFFGVPVTSMIRTGLLIGVSHALIVFILFVLMKKAAYYRGIAVLLVVDLLAAAWHLHFYAPKSFYDEPRMAGIVKSELKEGRLFSDRNDRPFVIRAPDNSVFWRYRQELEALRGYAASLYRIPVIFHTDLEGAISYDAAYLTFIIESLPWERKISMLSAGNVTVIVSDKILNQAGLQKIAAVPNLADRPWYVYRNRRTPDFPLLVSAWIYRKDIRDSLSAMLMPSFDVRNHVVLTGPPGDLVYQPCERPGVVRERKRSVHSESFFVENFCDAYLVFSDSFDPDWEVRIDDRKVDTVRANGSFGAIFMPPGKHVVTRDYRPRSVFIGALISAFTVLLLLLLQVFTQRAR